MIFLGQFLDISFFDCFWDVLEDTGLFFVGHNLVMIQLTADQPKSMV